MKYILQLGRIQKGQLTFYLYESKTISLNIKLIANE